MLPKNTTHHKVVVPNDKIIGEFFESYSMKNKKEKEHLMSIITKFPEPSKDRILQQFTTQNHNAFFPTPQQFV